MARLKYPVLQTAESGQWFRVRRKRQILGCCDCGLVHSVDFPVTKAGRLKMRAYRLDRVTAINRVRRRTGERPRQRPGRA